jgi:hypothetical protein
MLFMDLESKGSNALEGLMKLELLDAWRVSNFSFLEPTYPMQTKTSGENKTK